MRDPYDVLGIKRTASEAEVKRAFRKLAKENHPDKHGGSKKAQAKFSEIGSAYEILSDKEKREKFDGGEIDAEGKPRFQGFEAGSRGGGFENVDPGAFSDIFSGFARGAGGGARSFRFSTGGATAGGGGQEDILRSIFGGAGGGGRTAQPSAGTDVRAEVAVTLEDVAAAKKVTVSLPTGKNVAMKLPAGVTEGQTIRLSGQGQASGTGGAPGDALVTVRFVPHPLFRVEGSDLRLELPIGLEEAVLGAKIPVPTLSGRVQVTVPPGSSSGRTLRLKGKGLPGAKGPGDILVTPRITLPEKADPGLEDLMRRWREEGHPSPRGEAFG